MENMALSRYCSRFVLPSTLSLVPCWVLAVATLVCLIPSKVRLSSARTQVVEVTQKHAPVEK
jgi:hypothetical protein